MQSSVTAPNLEMVSYKPKQAISLMLPIFHLLDVGTQS